MSLSKIIERERIKITREECPKCKGEGYYYLTAYYLTWFPENNRYTCNKCSGRGYIEEEKTNKIEAQDF